MFIHIIVNKTQRGLKNWNRFFFGGKKKQNIRENPQPAMHPLHPALLWPAHPASRPIQSYNGWEWEPGFSYWFPTPMLTSCKYTMSKKVSVQARTEKGWGGLKQWDFFCFVVIQYVHIADGINPFSLHNSLICSCIMTWMWDVSLTFPRSICVCLSGWLHPEHRVSALSGAGGKQTVGVHFPAGHSGLHWSEMDHHQRPDRAATVIALMPRHTFFSNGLVLSKKNFPHPKWTGVSVQLQMDGTLFFLMHRRLCASLRHRTSVT